MALMSLAHLACHAQTIPAPIALKHFQEAHFITSITNVQTELGFVCSENNGVYFMFVLAVDVCQKCPISQFIHSHARAVYIDFGHILIQVQWGSSSPHIASFQAHILKLPTDCETICQAYEHEVNTFTMATSLEMKAGVCMFVCDTLQVCVSFD
jgi:hypothetical protein